MPGCLNERSGSPRRFSLTGKDNDTAHLSSVRIRIKDTVLGEGWGVPVGSLDGGALGVSL